MVTPQSLKSFPKPLKKDRPNLLRKRSKQEQWRKIREDVLGDALAGTLYKCFHCGKLFQKEEVCADHFPYSRGSRPDLFLDKNNLVCSCMNCNISNSPNRKHLA